MSLHSIIYNVSLYDMYTKHIYKYMYIHTKSIYNHHIYILKMYIYVMYIYDMYIDKMYIHA